MRKLYFVIAILLYTATTSAQNAGLDLSFAGKGYVQTGFGYHDYFNSIYCNQVLSHPDGSFYLVLQVNAQTYISHRLANGTLDAGYGDHGYSTSAWMLYPAAVLLPDGRIVLGGKSAENVNNPDFFLACYLPDGSLDNTFGVGGFQSTDFFGVDDQINALTLQPDGKIVAAGFSDSHFAIARYFPNGSIDNSFSNDGKDTIHFGSQTEIANSVGIKTDGRIVIAGESGSPAQPTLLSIAYYLPNGTRDNSFSGDGKHSLLLPGGRTVTSMELQPDGRMLFAGGHTVNAQQNFSVIRLLEDGSLDNSFSSDGMQTINFGAGSFAKTVKLHQGDKIVLAGHGFSGLFCLARLLPDGSLDNSFSGDGLVTTTMNIGFDALQSMAIQADGKILAAGQSFQIQRVFSVARYNIDGSLDNTFDGDGKLVDFKPSSATIFLASAVQADGKLVAVGETYVTQDATDVCVARYNVDGSLDNTFSGDGKLLLKFGAGRNSVNGVAIQQDGKIVIGGESRPSLFYGEFAVARLNPDGSLDNSFSDDGIVITDMGGFFDELRAICIQPDGKIVAGGSSNAVGPYFLGSFALARFNTDGTLDNTFSGDGILVEHVAFHDGIQTLLAQPDGKIIAVGGSTHYDPITTMEIVIARYNPDGTLDVSFNGTGIQVASLDVQTIAYSAALDASGRILISGFSGTGGAGQGILLRYLANGALDPSFSGDGVTTWSYSGLLRSIAVDAAGKIIAGGSEGVGYNSNAVVMRLNTDGTPDNTFSPGGKIVTDLGDNETVNSTNVFNNRIYTVGTSSFDGSTGLVIAYSTSCNLNVTIPNAMTLVNGVQPNTVYVGYLPAADLTLQAQPAGGTAPYSYLWSNGATSTSITIMPTTATNYTVTVTDAAGCRKTAHKFVNVVDVRCGNKLDKVLVCQTPPGNPSNANTNCISASAVAAQLNNGSYLGNCTEPVTTKANMQNNITPQQDKAGNMLLEVYPNPTAEQFTIVVRTQRTELIQVTVYDNVGRTVEKRTVSAITVIRLGSNYRPGVYVVEVLQAGARELVKVVKQGN